MPYKPEYKTATHSLPLGHLETEKSRNLNNIIRYLKKGFRGANVNLKMVYATDLTYRLNITRYIFV